MLMDESYLVRERVVDMLRVWVLNFVFKEILV